MIPRTTTQMTLRAERSRLAAYLLGLVSVLAIAVAALMRGRAMIAPQLAGAAVAGLGLAVLVRQPVPAP